MRFLILVCFLAELAACSSQPTGRELLEQRQSENQGRAQVQGIDAFWMGQRNPREHEPKKYEFYYKHCDLVSRRRYPSKVEYECTEPF